MLKSLLWISFCLVLLSCETRGDDTDLNRKSYELSNFAGIYRGEFIGPYTGILTMEVGAKGSVFTTLEFSDGSASVVTQGTVNVYGDLKPLYTPGGFHLEGSLLLVEEKYKGRWESGGQVGTWSALKNP